MEVCRRPREVQPRKSDDASTLTQPLTFEHKSPEKGLSELHVDSEDDLQHSRPPSMTDGSSRTSSVYEMSDHPSAPLSRSSFAQHSHYPMIYDKNSLCFLSGDESNVQQHQTGSPPLPRQSSSNIYLNPNSRVRDSIPPSMGLNDGEDVHACSTRPGPSTRGEPLGEMQEDSQYTKESQRKAVSAQSLVVAMSSSSIEDAKPLSGKAIFESETTKSNSDSEEESDDEGDDEDDNWSGANDYLETAIYQAVFPDLALAAHLISEMYSMLLLGSSKKISRQVSSWREKITTCAGTTVSGTTSTEKAAPASGSSSALGTGSSKRNRLSGSADSNIGEEEEDDDDDSDESRRKRLKDSNGGSGLEIPTPRLACPFNKMDPLRYGIQHNQEGKSRYRSCAGPGFLSIQVLKEHLKRKHYPVQCERCYVIFKVKGNSRSSAVAELGKHRQLDEVCPKRPSSMKEGISDAQWTNLIEEKQSRKGKAATTQLPKSDVDKWKDIWEILFPHLPVPNTPWYDTSSVDMAASSPSHGLRPYLKVYGETLNFKLHIIKEARSDDELKSLLLETAGKAFEVWSATRTWNEGLTSSLSNSGGSDPVSSSSWENISKPTSSLQRTSPKVSTAPVFPNLSQGDNNTDGGAVDNFPTSHTSTITNVRESPQSTPHSVSDVVTTPQGEMAVSGEFDFVGTHEAEYPIFSANEYPTNSTGIGGQEWMNHMEQMEAHANTFDLGIMSPQMMRGVPPQWGDQYHTRNFGRFGEGP